MFGLFHLFSATHSVRYTTSSTMTSHPFSVAKTPMSSASVYRGSMLRAGEKSSGKPMQRCQATAAASGAKMVGNHDLAKSHLSYFDRHKNLRACWNDLWHLEGPSRLSRSAAPPTFTCSARSTLQARYYRSTALHMHTCSPSEAVLNLKVAPLAISYVSSIMADPATINT